MKRHLAMIIIAVAALACKETGVEKAEQDIRYKESVVINDVPKATVTFFEFGDSRCPDGVNCFWAGYAKVDLLLLGVTTEGGVSEHVKMCLGDCRFTAKDSAEAGKRGYVMADTVAKNFAGQNYRFILSSLSAGPRFDPATDKFEDTPKKEDRMITLKIEKN